MENKKQNPKLRVKFDSLDQREKVDKSDTKSHTQFAVCPDQDWV